MEFTCYKDYCIFYYYFKMVGHTSISTLYLSVEVITRHARVHIMCTLFSPESWDLAAVGGQVGWSRADGWQRNRPDKAQCR